jgi:hypothetical protein
MPVYFGPVAPTCPIGQDQAPSARGSARVTRPIFVRPTIPLANDLESAIRVANLARSIVTAITQDKTINNVHNPNVKGSTSVAPIKNNKKTSRWVEQKQKRVFRKYKYYAKDKNGKKDKSTWVTMERIEQMVWYDRVWKSYLKWKYGNKGEGEPVGKAFGPGVGGT